MNYYSLIATLNTDKLGQCSCFLKPSLYEVYENECVMGMSYVLIHLQFLSQNLSHRFLQNLILETTRKIVSLVHVTCM